MTLAAIFLGVILGYCVFSRRLQRTVLTAPMVFTSAGILTLLLAPGERGLEGHRGVFLQVAEMGLVLLLFADASRTDLRVLRGIRALPTRLLSTGMLLTLALGMIAAKAVYPEFSLWEAGILAAILAPTDAGLGQAIVQSPRVPVRIRQALNVEAGLNDGLCVPFLMFSIALAQASAESPATLLVRYAFEQIGLGCLIGIGIGGGGGLLLGAAKRRGWMAESLQGLALVSLPVLCAMASDAVHASMFIAAFVAGLAVQWGFDDAGKHSLEFTEGWGELLNWFVFYLFGLFTVLLWKGIVARHVLYAVLSLTIVRMIPVAIALMGTRLKPATVLFMGWFGPRGLASIVLGLVYLEMESHLPGEGAIRSTVLATVLLSIYAHGITVLPGIDLYLRRIAGLGENAPEYGSGAGAVTAPG